MYYYSVQITIKGMANSNVEVSIFMDKHRNITILGRLHGLFKLNPHATYRAIWSIRGAITDACPYHEYIKSRISNIIMAFGIIYINIWCHLVLLMGTRIYSG